MYGTQSLLLGNRILSPPLTSSRLDVYRPLPVRFAITSNPAARRPQPHSAHCHGPFSALERVRDSGACSPQSSAGKAPSVHRWEHCWSAHLTTVVARVSEGIHHRTNLPVNGRSAALLIPSQSPNVICDGSRPLECGGLAPRAATWSTVEQRIRRIQRSAIGTRSRAATDSANGLRNPAESLNGAIRGLLSLSVRSGCWTSGWATTRLSVRPAAFSN